MGVHNKSLKFINIKKKALSIFITPSLLERYLTVNFWKKRHQIYEPVFLFKSTGQSNILRNRLYYFNNIQKFSSLQMFLVVKEIKMLIKTKNIADRLKFHTPRKKGADFLIPNIWKKGWFVTHFTPPLSKRFCLLNTCDILHQSWVSIIQFLWKKKKINKIK